MSVLATPGAVYLVGLQADSLIVWRLQGRRFVVVANESQFHPVSVAASLVDGSFYVAVANRHRVGLTRSETIDMYRYLYCFVFMASQSGWTDIVHVENMHIKGVETELIGL